MNISIQTNLNDQMKALRKKLEEASNEYHHSLRKLKQNASTEKLRHNEVLTKLSDTYKYEINHVNAKLDTINGAKNMLLSEYTQSKDTIDGLKSSIRDIINQKQVLENKCETFETDLCKERQRVNEISSM